MLESPIIANNESIDIDNYFISNFEVSKCVEIRNFHIKEENGIIHEKTNCIKVIAGSKIDLPTIDFSELSKDNKDMIGWHDIDQLFLDFEKLNGNTYNLEYEAFLYGFNKSKDLNNKLYTLDDLCEAFFRGREIKNDLNKSIYPIELEPKYTFNSFRYDYLAKKITFDVSIVEKNSKIYIKEIL